MTKDDKDYHRKRGAEIVAQIQAARKKHEEQMTEEKKLKVEIAPGAFDNFEGTQEELQDLLAQIHQMAEDGTLFENSTPVSDEEAEAAWQRIEEAAKRQ